MEQMKLKKIFYYLVSIAIFSLAFPTMFEVYSIPNEQVIFGTLILYGAIGAFIPSFILRLFLYFLTYMSSLYVRFFYLEKRSLFVLLTAQYQTVEKILLDLNSPFSLMIPFTLILFFLMVIVEIQFFLKTPLYTGMLLISYLMLLDVFNEIDIVHSVIVIACLSLVLHVSIQNGTSWKRLLVSSVLISLIGMGTMIFPKMIIQNNVLTVARPIRVYLNDQGLYRYIANRGEGTQNRTGFGEDDSRLGGSIADDDTIQFKVSQKQPHYWRVDTKSTYTGKGWESSLLEEEVKGHFDKEIHLGTSSLTSNNEEEIVMTQFYQGTYVPTTYGDWKIKGIENNNQFDVNEKTDRVTMKYLVEENQISQKGQALNINNQELEEGLPTNGVDYLQLPANLPKEVKNKAEELTKDDVTRIEKVESIQNYLKNSSDFRYSKLDASYPSDKQDYVAHFLFETSVGYCDNFSTSMAVLLRTIDVPTRWVKGFSPGSVSGKDGSQDVYTIRNTNAHSWVEVYFDDYGWLPFDPTPTFSAPIIEEKEREKTQPSDALANNLPREKEQEKTNHSTNESKKNSNPQEAAKEKKKLIIPYKKIAILFSVVGVCFGVLYLRKNWLYLFVWLMLHIKGQTTFDLFPCVLKEAERRVPRKSNQPLDTYAIEVEAFYPEMAGEFIHLVSIYEMFLYGNQDTSTHEDQKILLQVIRKLRSTRNEKIH